MKKLILLLLLGLVVWGQSYRLLRPSTAVTLPPNADFAPHTLTAHVQAPYYVSASSQEAAPYHSYKALDGQSDAGQYWVSVGTAPQYLQVEFSTTAYTLLKYQIMALPSSVGGDDATRTPNSWTMQGSNDGATWNTVDTVSGQTAWAKTETREFICDVRTTAYRFFKLNITADNGGVDIRVTEVYLYAATPLPGAPVDFAPHNMTSNVLPSPYVASSSAIYGTRAAWKAFDGATADDGGTDWIGNTGGTGYLQIDLGSGNENTLGSYTVHFNGLVDRAPKTWTMLGSNNGTDWSTLDTVSGQTSWAAPSSRTFVCDTQTTAYRYFRFSFTENNGDAGYTQVAQLYLWEL